MQANEFQKLCVLNSRLPIPVPVSCEDIYDKKNWGVDCKADNKKDWARITNNLVAMIIDRCRH